MTTPIALSTKQLSSLIELLSQPTAPFRESLVKRWLIDQLEQADVPFFEDAIGNIIAGCENERRYRSLLKTLGKSVIPIFIAHMDHPGFLGVRWQGDGHLEAAWFGGSPIKHIDRAKVWVANADGYWAQASIKSHVVAKHGFGLERLVLRIDAMPEGKRPAAKHLFGGFAFRKPAWRAGRKIYTKAADDLVGVFCALQALSEPRARSASPVLAMFSRAEEVGFVGAVAHFEHYGLRARRHRLRAVSLEASRTLPGALIGKGVIVRVGDRRTAFDADGIQGLTNLAEAKLGKAFQKRIMDGGACEGTAATAYGVPTIAMSVPLGNYHNQGFEGGLDCRKPHGPAPEFVHVDDIAGMLTLCREIAKQPNVFVNDPWGSIRARLVKNYQSLKKHL